MEAGRRAPIATPLSRSRRDRLSWQHLRRTPGLLWKEWTAAEVRRTAGGHMHSSSSRIRLGIGAGLAATAVLAMAGCSGTAAKSTTGNGTAAANSPAGTANASAVSLVADAMNKATSAGTVRLSGSLAANGLDMTMSGVEQYSPSVEMSL